jgi:hypothetical protein
MAHTTQLYRSLMREVDRRRHELNWRLWMLDDKSGLNDGHVGKALAADSPSRRQLRWDSLQLVIDALWPDGVEVKVRAIDDEMESALRLEPNVNAPARMVRLRRHNGSSESSGPKADKPTRPTPASDGAP